MASYRIEVHGELKNQGASEKSKRQQKSYEICQGKCRFTDDTSCTAHFTTFDNIIEVCKSHYDTRGDGQTLKFKACSRILCSYQRETP